MDMTERSEAKPATAARIYDFYLGGTLNFPADRAAAETVLARAPMIRPAARANRKFLGRAVRLAAEAGIRQFLDIGSGIPTEGNVHEVAQAIDPSARVVYVDIDPVAVSEGLDILDGNPFATSVRGDVLRADRIISHPGVTALIDFSKPVAVMLCALLHFVPDDDAAHAAVAAFRDVSAPGSFLIMSHGTPPDDFVDAVHRASFAAGEKAVQGVYARQTTTPVRMRPRDEVATFFQGYELLEPGLQWVGRWRSEDPDEPEFEGNSSLCAMMAGVGVLR
jgi:hypothetical protein